MPEDEKPEVEATENLEGGDDQKKTEESSTLLGEKTEDAEKAGEKKEGEEKTKGAPEKYEAFTMPEGMPLNEGMVGKFSEFAKGANLTQDNAQALVNMAAELIQSNAADNAAAWSKTQETWVSDLKSDSTFGGAKFVETVESAKRALKIFGSPELDKALKDYGFGNFGPLVKMLAKVDKATREDRGEEGAPVGTGAPESAANILYPNHGKT